MSDTNSVQQDGQTEVIEEKKLDEPCRYKVLLHNDHYTTIDFVCALVCHVFHKSPIEAEAIARKVHKEGIGVCGIYTREIAEAKVSQVLQEARLAGFPLLCTMEEA